MPTVLASSAGIRGKRRDGVYVNGIIPQFDGSPYASANCGACSEAVRVVAQQFGKRPAKGSPWPPTGASIRRETGDTSGGLNPSQTTAASKAEYGVAFAAPRIAGWSKVTDFLWDGYHVDLLVDYSLIDNYLSGSPGFGGNHRLGLGGITDVGTNRALSRDSLYDGRRSGIPLGPRWIPLSILRGAAGLLDLGGGTTVTERYGPGHAYFIPSLTRVEAPKPTLRVKVTCDTVVRRGASRESQKLGSLNSGDILIVTATSEGGHWSGCGKEGTKWRRFISVNGKSTTSLYGRAYAYCASALTQPI